MPQNVKPAAANAPAPLLANHDAGGFFVDNNDATDLAPHSFADGNPTGFLENLGAGFDETLRSGLTVSKARSRALAYGPIMDAINADKSSSDHLTNPWAGASLGNGGTIRQHAGTLGIDLSGPWAGVTPEDQEATVWAEIERRRARDPGFLPGVPKSRQDLNRLIDENDRKALEADDDIGRRATVLGSAGSFVGGIGASFRDPVNVLTLPLGAGGAKTILGAAVREGAFNAALTAAEQPAIAQRNQELGRTYGLEEGVTSTLYAGIGGMVLGAGAKGLEKGARVLGDRLTLARMKRITSAAESTDHELDENGNVLTSPKGAKGSMQVLDSTNLDPGFGVKPARDNSLAERKRVGGDYLDALMKHYGNDPAKAWGAYNWGPGKLDKAIAAHGADWLDHAPKETRDYVRGNLKRLGVNVGDELPAATGDQVSAAITLEGLDELRHTSPLPAGDVNDGRHFATLQTHIDALEQDAPRPLARVDPIELKRPTETSIDSYDPRDLIVDAKRFQFKGGADEAGVTDRLAGVKEWSPVLSGKAVVWLDNEGKPHVADGHQRVGLARRLLNENPGQDIKIDAVTLREADGITAEMARTWAALKNVAEGSGTAIDAAKILRTTGDKTPIPLPPRSSLVRDARSLAELSDDAFGMVVNELVPPEFAAMVGRLAPNTPELHAAYLQLLHRLAPANLTQAESVIRQAIAAGATRETQLGLFGEEIVSRSLYLERARVLDNALRRIKQEKRTFRTLVDAKDDIEAAGNALATDANAAKVENNAKALEILTRLAHRTGPVSDALGAAAAELAAGRTTKSAVDRFLTELDGLNLSELARGMERSGGDGRIPGEVGRAGGANEPPQQVDSEPAPSEPAAGGGVDGGLGEPIGTDLFGDPIYAPAIDELGEEISPLEASIGEAREAGQLEAFSDPHGGEGPRVQTELLEHDVRMLAEATQGAQEAQQRPRLMLGTPGATLSRWDVVAGQRGQSLDSLLASAATNQAELNAIGPELAGKDGEFVAAPPKTAESAARKIAEEGYAEPGMLVDLTRASFIVDSQAAGDAIAKRLGDRFAVHDKGWKRIEANGYYDRKLILQLPNGGTAEVQIIPRKVHAYKKAEGHKLYDEARRAGTSPERRDALNEQSRAGYDAALADWEGQVSGNGTSGNSAEKSLSVSGEPSKAALAGSLEPDTGAHSLPDQANARSPEASDTSATGRSSSSNNRTLDINTPAADMGEAAANVNAAVTWEVPETQAAIAAHNQAAADRAAASRPSSQDRSAGDRNGSGPSSDSGAGAAGHVAGDRRQAPSDAISARTPELDETKTAGQPAARPSEAIITPPAELAASGDDLGITVSGEGVDPNIARRNSDLTRLGAASPLRGAAEQADVDGLALFDQARSPELFALSDRLEGDAVVPDLRTAEDVLAELDAEDAAIKAIKECMA